MILHIAKKNTFIAYYTFNAFDICPIIIYNGRLIVSIIGHYMKLSQSVQKKDMLSLPERFVFGLLILLGIILTTRYLLWWIQPSNFPTN